MKKIFNLNTGYFIKELIYDYESKYYIGYMICKGYIIFGIPGYDVIKDGYCCDFITLTEKLEKYNINLKLGIL